MNEKDNKERERDDDEYMKEGEMDKMKRKMLIMIS